MNNDKKYNHFSYSSAAFPHVKIETIMVIDFTVEDDDDIDNTDNINNSNVKTTYVTKFTPIYHHHT